MECKPQISKLSFTVMTQDDKLNSLYDMQSTSMECIQHIEEKIEKRKLLDRISVVAGGVVGGVLGALGFKSVS